MHGGLRGARRRPAAAASASSATAAASPGAADCSTWWASATGPAPSRSSPAAARACPASRRPGPDRLVDGAAHDRMAEAEAPHVVGDRARGPPPRARPAPPGRPRARAPRPRRRSRSRTGRRRSPRRPAAPARRSAAAWSRSAPPRGRPRGPRRARDRRRAPAPAARCGRAASGGTGCRRSPRRAGAARRRLRAARAGATPRRASAARASGGGRGPRRRRGAARGPARSRPGDAGGRCASSSRGGGRRTIEATSAIDAGSAQCRSSRISVEPARRGEPLEQRADGAVQLVALHGARRRAPPAPGTSRPAPRDRRRRPAAPCAARCASSASISSAYGTSRSYSEQRALSTSAPASFAEAPRCSSRVVLPIPASPTISITERRLVPHRLIQHGDLARPADERDVARGWIRVRHGAGGILRSLPLITSFAFGTCVVKRAGVPARPDLVDPVTVTVSLVPVAGQRDRRSSSA